jgi:carbonic anhydrase/acetyltransferase-like protein (isoleucine patch superfamily)
MALIKTLNGKTPRFGSNCFLADNAVIIGDVVMGDDCSVWFNTVLRGDVHSIRIGNRVNIQDNATIHCTYQKAATSLGSNISIAHNAVVHGCTIHDTVLVGMGAIVMDNAVIESNCIIASGAVVLENTIVEANSIYAGTPAKKIKTVSPELIEGQIQRIAASYLMYAGWYK